MISYKNVQYVKRSMHWLIALVKKHIKHWIIYLIQLKRSKYEKIVSNTTIGVIPSGMFCTRWS